MTATACALLSLVAWAILLTFALVFTRGAAGAKGKAINSFSPAGTDLDGFGYRVTRAHGNTLENLAILASLLLYAIATQQTQITDGLAAVLVGARVVQSVVHIASGGVPAVLLRASAFSVQMVIGLYWCWQFWQVGTVG